MPDGCLLAVGIPLVLAVLHEAVQHRLVLPLIIRASQHKAVLHPDAAACKVESRIDKRPAEVQSFRIGMEHICSAAFFEVVCHTLESGEQKVIELLVFHAVVLNGQPAGAFERYPIWGIGQNEVCFRVAHKSADIFGTGRVAAHEAMPADRPNISSLHKGSLLQRSGQVEIVVLCFAVGIIREQVSQFLFIKAGHGEVVAEVLQLLHFNGKQLIVPACIQCHAVIGKDVGFLLRFCQVIDVHARHFRDAFLLRRHQTTVTGDHVIVSVDDDGVNEPEFPQRRPELCDLLRRVRAGVIDIGNQLCRRNKLKFCGCFHARSPFSLRMVISSARPVGSRPTTDCKARTAASVPMPYTPSIAPPQEKPRRISACCSHFTTSPTQPFVIGKDGAGYGFAPGSLYGTVKTMSPAVSNTAQFLLHARMASRSVGYSPISSSLPMYLTE